MVVENVVNGSRHRLAPNQNATPYLQGESSEAITPVCNDPPFSPPASSISDEPSGELVSH